MRGRGRVHIIPCPLHPWKIKTNPIKTRTKIKHGFWHKTIWIEQKQRWPRKWKGKKIEPYRVSQIAFLWKLLENKLTRSPRTRRKKTTEGVWSDKIKENNRFGWVCLCSSLELSWNKNWDKNTHREWERENSGKEKKQTLNTQKLKIWVRRQKLKKTCWRENIWKEMVIYVKTEGSVRVFMLLLFQLLEAPSVFWVFFFFWTLLWVDPSP